jgi:phosphatidylglycerophosphatase A
MLLALLYFKTTSHIIDIIAALLLKLVCVLVLFALMFFIMFTWQKVSDHCEILLQQPHYIIILDPIVSVLI